MFIWCPSILNWFLECDDEFTGLKWPSQSPVPSTIESHREYNYVSTRTKSSERSSSLLNISHRKLRGSEGLITPCGLMMCVIVSSLLKRLLGLRRLFRVHQHGLVLWWFQVSSVTPKQLPGTMRKHKLSFRATESRVLLKGLCVNTFIAPRLWQLNRTYCTQIYRNCKTLNPVVTNRRMFKVDRVVQDTFN